MELPVFFLGDDATPVKDAVKIVQPQLTGHGFFLGYGHAIPPVRRIAGSSSIYTRSPRSARHQPAYVSGKCAGCNWLILCYNHDITNFGGAPWISTTYALSLIHISAPSGEVTADFVLQVVLVFVLTNIPTVLLIGIYCACREKVRRKKEMEKMNIQDLQ